MQIRPATVNDAEIISTLNAEVQRIHAAALPGLFKPPSRDTFPPAVVVELLADPNTYMYIGRLDGKDVGYIYAQVRRLPETPLRYATEMVYIHHISIDPEYRHRGLGELLLDEVKKLARQKEISLVALDVWSFNARAHAFFTRQGFSNFNERMWLEIEQPSTPAE